MDDGPIGQVIAGWPEGRQGCWVAEAGSSGEGGIEAD